MMSYWLDKTLGVDDDGNNLAKFAPLVIFFVIWLFGVIAKAAQKGKKGTETESSQVDKDIADKIRERYGYAHAQKEAGREVQQEEIEQFQPPARMPQPEPPPPRRSEPIPAKTPPMYFQEGPTLTVVKALEKPNAGIPLAAEKPTLQKVEPGLQKKVSSEVEIIHHQYLSEMATQYSTADGLRKAILNYEILGPPLALRE
jgi:hypothetical protein